MERLYPYTGDANTVVFLQDIIDYELENGLTPESYVWAGVPYTSANPGDHHYTGWSRHGEDYIEPHVVGEDGYAYLRVYEMTGNTKYLRAAIRCAEALAKNYKSGDGKNSPWPVRCYARDGKVQGEGMGPYSANVVEPIMLLDELIRLEQGDVAAYRRVRQGAWEWLHKYPMKNNVWVGYFEDVPPRMENMNQVIPLEYARYVLLHPEKDLEWRDNARKLIEWVKTTPKWPKYNVAPCRDRGALLCADGRRGIQGESVPIVQLGNLLPGHAPLRPHPVRQSMVVHRRIRGWASPLDGRFLGGSGVGARRRVPPGRLGFGGDEDCLRQGVGYVLHVRSEFDRCPASQLCS
jgi:hypothetical protein